MTQKMMLSMCLGVLLLGNTAVLQAAPEYRIKAALLYNLARMVEWPNAGILSTRDPFPICFIGEEPFGDTLDTLLKKEVRNRPLAFNKDISLAQVANCAILFISASEAPRLADILQHVSGFPILTVGDVPGFAERGVMINMQRDEKKVKLEINRNAVESVGLIISPTLLELATQVGGK